MLGGVWTRLFCQTVMFRQQTPEVMPDENKSVFKETLLVF